VGWVMSPDPDLASTEVYSCGLKPAVREGRALLNDLECSSTHSKQSLRFMHEQWVPGRVTIGQIETETWTTTNVPQIGGNILSWSGVRPYAPENGLNMLKLGRDDSA